MTKTAREQLSSKRNLVLAIFAGACLVSVAYVARHFYVLHDSRKQAIEWLHKRSFRFIGGRNDAFLAKKYGWPYPEEKGPTVEEWFDDGRKIPNLPRTLGHLLLEDDENLSKEQIAHVLGYLGNKESIGFLVSAYARERGDITYKLLCFDSICRLGNTDDFLLFIVEQYKTSPDALIRARAIDALSEHENRISTETIMLALTDKDEFVRKEAEKIIFGKEKEVEKPESYPTLHVHNPFAAP